MFFLADFTGESIPVADLPVFSKEYQSFPSIQEAHNPLYPIMVSNGFFVIKLPLSAYSSGDAVRLCVAPKFITSKSTPLKSLSGLKQQ